MDTSSPSPLRLQRTYEQVLLTLTDDEARLVFHLDPPEFWEWYEGRHAGGPGAEPSARPIEVRP